MRLALKLFRENQLSPSSIGISPLPTVHPLTFQRKSVRSSIQCYLNFNLTMGRSPGFGSTTKYYALFRLAFATAPHFCQIVTRRFILQKARHHPLTAHGFFSFHSPSGYFSPFPHGTGSLSVTRVFSLRRWSSQIPTEFHVLRRTQDPLKREYIFNYRIITFFDSTFQMIRLIYSFVTPYRVSYNPNKQAYWFALPVSLAATRESISSLPPGTKMFQFSGSAF